MVKSSILIIDTDQKNIDEISDILQDENYSIHSTLDAEEAIGLIEKQAPLCILIDIQVKNIGCIGFLEKIKFHQNSGFSIVAMTAHKEIESSKVCYQKGVFEIIEKPLNAYDLLCVVRNAVTMQQRNKRISYQEYIDHLSKERTDALIKQHKNLTDSREVIENAYKLKSELISDISHEIRNPLNVIMNFSSMLIDMYRQKDFHEFETLLEAIKVSSTNLARILDNIIIISEIESGSVNEEIESFDIKQTLGSIVSLFKVKAGEKSIAFSYSCNECITDTIVSDKIKVKQIIMALMEFGYKNTNKNGSIDLHVDIKKDELWFSVTIHNHTMQMDEMNTLFESKVDLGSEDFKGYSGLGIGLPMSKKYAKLIKGDLVLQSASPKECSLLFKLPYVEAADPTKKADWTDIQFKPESKILLVEDQPINVMIIKKMLKKMGLEIEVAMNGKIGVEKAISMRPDLILMDVQMPVMDGMEATRIIRETKGIKDTPIVGVSAYTAKEKEMLNMKFTDFIVKPINKARFVQILSKYLPREDVV